MWQQWRHPELAALWSREPAWAQRPGLAGPWPRILCAEPDQLDALARDLRAFEPSDVLGNGIPDGVPRFSEGEWPLEPLADVIATLVEGMRAWVEAARALQLPLVAWLDGQQ
jgi:hypothetical protein